jgi:hypothetical protein
VLDGNFRLPTCGRDCGTLVLREFAIESTGTIDATVNYTHDETSLGVWIATGACNFDQFVADQCSFAAMGFSGKPRRVSATNQAPGPYTLAIANFGPHDEALAFQVVFTAQAAASADPGVRQRPLNGVRGWGINRLVPAGR